jgi:hypothetical protein
MWAAGAGSCWRGACCTRATRAAASSSTAPGCWTGVLAQSGALDCMLHIMLKCEHFGQLPGVLRANVFDSCSVDFKSTFESKGVLDAKQRLSRVSGDVREPFPAAVRIAVNFQNSTPPKGRTAVSYQAVQKDCKLSALAAPLLPWIFG